MKKTFISGSRLYLELLRLNILEDNKNTLFPASRLYLELLRTKRLDRTSKCDFITPPLMSRKCSGERISAA